MYTILADGESKVGKSSVTGAIVDGLEQDGYSVQFSDAGAFYRRLTVATLDRMAEDPSLDIEDALPSVIADGIAYQDEYQWGDLERDEIGKIVTTIGSLSQDAGQEWYKRTAENALDKGVDVLVINGRNPRARLAEPETGISASKLGICLELVIQCSPEIAGLRAAHALYGYSPTEAEIADQTLNVAKRRQLDRERADNPYIDPPCMLRYEPDVTDVGRLVTNSWDAPGDIAPRPIGFDNSYVDLDAMTRGIQTLVKHALKFVP